MRAVQQPLERLLTLAVMLAGAEKLREASALEIRSHEAPDELPILGDMADSPELQMMQQRMDMLRLDTERQVYEKKLKQQTDDNAELARKAAQLESDVAQMKTYNSKFLDNAKKLQEGNEERRQEIKLLSEQFEKSVSTMRATADTTDPGQYKELEVLKPSNTAFIQLESDEKTDPFHSIAEDIINDVSAPEAQQAVASSPAQKKSSAPEATDSLALITDTSKMSRKQKEEKLKQTFLEHKKAGEQKHEELSRQLEALNKTLVSQQSYAARLITATKSLKQIRSKLDDRLKEVQQFFRHMDSYVEQHGIVASKKTKAAVEQLQALNKAEDQATKKKSLGKAADKSPYCADWAARGECKKNPRFMLDQCSIACAGL